MSDEIEINLPKLGESIVSATIVQWFKKEGDSIKLDEPLLEVSTDKVTSEIPSPVSGTLTQIFARPHEEVDVGALLAKVAPKNSPSLNLDEQKKVEEVPPSSDHLNKGVYTPVVLRMAQNEGITVSELETIPRTGVGGRLSKRDLEAYLASRKEESLLGGAGAFESVKMSPMRKKIAEAMVHSFYSAPHATLVSEVDVTKVIRHLRETKEKFFQENGYKITVTTYIARAISAAIKKYPMMNASIQGETILVKKHIHLGIAISAFEGVLVPVIQHSDALSVKEMAQKIAELVEKVQSKRLEVKDTEGGTFTMTNFGMAGALIGTPIIRQPEVAILGIGAIHKKVMVLEEDTLAIRSMVYLSLAFDHRIIDGIYGCDFLKEIKKELEEAAEL